MRHLQNLELQISGNEIYYYRLVFQDENHLITYWYNTASQHRCDNLINFLCNLLKAVMALAEKSARVASPREHVHK